MSSEEEDYMSEKFLAKCLPVNDAAPGLIQTHSLKRQHLMHKKTEEKRSKRKQTVPTRILEANRREEGLQESIGSDNKGYALMQKMGYKPGQGIGKEKTGIAEPISITVKTDRFGLGRATVLKEISEWKARKRVANLQQWDKECNVEDFRKRLADKAHDKEIQYDLKKSQKICKTLDIDKDIKEPDELWFWPEVVPEEEEEELEVKLEEIEFEPPEKLKLLTSYLRECHLYCIWCGTHFHDPEDLTASCPGPSKEFH